MRATDARRLNAVRTGWPDRGTWLAWARHSIPVVYFLGLLAWEVSAGNWQDPLTDPLAALLSLSTAAYLSIIIACYLRRGPAVPLRRGDRWAQVVALAGANLLTPLALMPLIYPALETVAVAAGVLGLALSIWSIWHLGTAFSLVPEARRLVRTGPYRWVRHPLYLAGFVIGLGLLLANLSPAALGLFLAFVASQVLRIRYEEEVLEKAFPEYGGYRERTWALIPHIF